MDAREARGQVKKKITTRVISTCPLVCATWCRSGNRGKRAREYQGYLQISLVLLDATLANERTRDNKTNSTRRYGNRCHLLQFLLHLPRKRPKEGKKC